MVFENRSKPKSTHSNEELHKMSKLSSSSYSFSSSSLSRKTNGSIKEFSVKTYCSGFEKYLFYVLEKEALEGVPTQRSDARQKLLRLNNLQFQELATDVYDELIRRTLNEHSSFLSIRDEFHPRRNQARQKLATLQAIRFKDLASDIHHELLRRYRQFVNVNEKLSDGMIQIQGSQIQPTHIIPVKGLMSVESIDLVNDDNNTILTETESVDSLMEDLGNMVKPFMRSEDSFLENGFNMERMKYDFEKRIESMTAYKKSLELSLEESLNTQIIYPSEASKNLKLRMKQISEAYSDLDQKYIQLNKDHIEQQKVVYEVKREIKQLIEELKSLSSMNESLRLDSEKNNEEINQLIQENKLWKRKFENINMELRNFKVNSIILENYDLSKDFSLKPTLSGAIGQNYVIDYQNAIDDLIKASRSNKPSDVLISMRSIVMTCKSITTTVEYYEINVGLSNDDRESLYDIKRKLTAELTNLLTATKHFIGGMGISPVSLLDASAGNLTIIVVDLIRLLGMSPVYDLDGGTHSVPILTNDTTFSLVKSQIPKDWISPEKLSEFLKAETDHIVSNIKSLLNALRSSNNNIYSIITTIVKVVQNIVKTSRLTLSFSEGLKYKKKGISILDDLNKCNNKIIQIRDVTFSQSPENATAIVKRNLAQESYEIANYTKELLNILDM